MIAVVIAPLVSSLLVVSALMLFFMLGIPGEPPDLLQVIVLFIGYVLLETVVGVAPFTYLGIFLVGFPSWLLLRFTNNESAAAYALLGAFGGWWLGPVFGGHKWSTLPLHWIGTGAGALTLFLFWRMARRR